MGGAFAAGALVLGLAAFAAGCAEGPVVPNAVTVSAAPVSSNGEARRPDGVVVEPPSARPTPVVRAEAHGVVALREPLDPGEVARVVQAIASAWQHASLDELVALLTADAGPVDPAAGQGRSVLTESFRQRLQAHEYGRLAGVELVRPERIERWEWDDLGTRDTPARPPEMRPGELYVRAPLEVTHAGGEKLFGGAIVIVLRREHGGLRIAAYGESDP